MFILQPDGAETQKNPPPSCGCQVTSDPASNTNRRPPRPRGGGGVSILRLVPHGKQISAHSSRLMMSEQWPLSQERIFISAPTGPPTPPDPDGAPKHQSDTATDGFRKFTLGVSYRAARTNSAFSSDRRASLSFPPNIPLFVWGGQPACLLIYYAHANTRPPHLRAFTHKEPEA